MRSRLDGDIHRVAAAAGLAALCFAPFACAACAAEELQRFPAAAQAANDWAGKQGLVLTQPVIDAVLGAFCEAAQLTQSRRGISDEKLNQLAVQVVPDYLDLEVKPDEVMKSMSVVLNNALGASGLVMPQPRRLAQLTITYGDGVTRPEQLRIRNQLVPAQTLMLVVAGRVDVEGIKSGSTVCRGGGDALAGVPLKISCKK